MVKSLAVSVLRVNAVVCSKGVGVFKYLGLLS